MLVLILQRKYATMQILDEFFLSFDFTYQRKLYL